jgi:ribosome biogenesis GTPase / thiamine phosphate phosphatase
MTIEHDPGALSALGWNDVHAQEFAAYAEPGVQPARVIAEHRDLWIVAGSTGARAARLAGRLRRDSTQEPQLHPAVGDWVVVQQASNAGQVRIVGVLTRRSAFVRKEAGLRATAQVVAANVDIALIVSALSNDVVLRRIERYLTLAWESGATPVVVLSKSDLVSDATSYIAQVQTAAPGPDVLALSALTGDGIDALLARLERGRTSVLLGSSGVGKSTLVNRLLGSDRQRTAAVRDDGRGRHTTTHRELLRLPDGALLIDTPGMRELQLWSADTGLESAFADVESLSGSCRFADCAHESEPGCAVREAVANGRLPSSRLAHWRQLSRELAWLERRRDQRLASECRKETRAVMREARRHQRRKRP